MGVKNLLNSIPVKTEYTSTEVASYLGLSRMTVWRHSQSGLLNVEVRSVRITVVKREALENYVYRLHFMRGFPEDA